MYQDGLATRGKERQLCLAHLLREAQCAIDAGDIGFAPGFHKLLQRAVAIGQRRAELKDTTLAQYRADLDRLLAMHPRRLPECRVTDLAWTSTACGRMASEILPASRFSLTFLYHAILTFC